MNSQLASSLPRTHSPATPAWHNLTYNLALPRGACIDTHAKLVSAPRFIIGQDDAKRAVAVAYRNRWRRKRVPAAIRDDIVPKNILMCGPTGCGKTEIARRLAKLANSPFVKVRAGRGRGQGAPGVGRAHGRTVMKLYRLGVGAEGSQKPRRNGTRT